MNEGFATAGLYPAAFVPPALSQAAPAVRPVRVAGGEPVPVVLLVEIEMVDAG